jgi:hypothetical protein
MHHFWGEAVAAKLKKFSDAGGSQSLWLPDAVRNQFLSSFVYTMRALICSLLLLAQAVFAAEKIGTVLASEGIVKATGGQADRALSKGSDIFEQETIVVGANSRAQIRFTDGGLMNLIPDTEFRVNDYAYKKIFEKDKSSGELVKGGFRALSGSIAKKNPNGYEVKTPSATIGLRGTMIEVRIGSAGVFFGVENGRALVQNAAGSTMIGVGEKASFSLVPGNNIPPELIFERPRELDFSIFSPPKGGVSLEAAQQAAAAPATAAPSRGAEEAPPPRPGAPTVGPTIGETPDQEGSGQIQPMGGGAAVGGGC